MDRFRMIIKSNLYLFELPERIIEIELPGYWVFLLYGFKILATK